MKQLGEVSRVNYANQMHHKEKLRHQIDPHMIEELQVSQDPNRNYRNVKKMVYQDQLEKTVAYHEEKKAQDKVLAPYLVEPRYGSLHKNLSTVNLGNKIYENRTHSNSGYLKTNQGPAYTDYDQENTLKKHAFIQRQNHEGHGFFRSQDQYQLRKQQEAAFARETLQQQLQQKQEKKLHLNLERHREIEALKENRQKQVEMEIMRNHQKKIELLSLGNQVKQQAEVERSIKQRKSYFDMGHMGKHNPITNPIEEHIDNPYILKSYQDKAYHH